MAGSYGHMGQFGSTSVNLDNPEKDKNEEILHSKSISRGDEVWKNAKSAVEVMPEAFNLGTQKIKILWLFLYYRATKLFIS